MKRILLFGAGKSATFLIDYLYRICTDNQWELIVADTNLDILRHKFSDASTVIPININAERSQERRALIQTVDLVVSLLPPALHILIAQDCLEFSKSLLTASYIDEEIRSLSKQIKEKKLFFLCEMGLDPGIDHMSAMQIIHRIQDNGGRISWFRSHTGGLVAPESDNNPWHYKISWNPVNVVKAGVSGAVFLENGQLKKIEYGDLFESTGKVDLEPWGSYAFYPNRDSLAYIPVYGLESAHTFIRTTLRHPDYCEGWKNIVRAKLTSDEFPDPHISRTYANWSKPILPFTHAGNRKMYEQMGLFQDIPLPENLSSAKILQSLLEKNWKMEESDKDMILMLHEFKYEKNGHQHALRSRLAVIGENSQRTAMAKTVGLPLGIAAKLILENKMNLTGLHIPIIREIYEPVLAELSSEGIRFQEEII